MSAEGFEIGLRGRRQECDALRRLLEAARAGHSQAMVLRGEPGIGKSALLGFLTQNASGYQIARVVGVESEMELPFAGLHQLCGPMVGSFDRLPPPQRAALEIAFGMEAGPAPDRFMVGLAVLTLLDDVAATRPLLCVVDDAHWLDDASLQTLGFVARRLLVEPIALVFATRLIDDARALGGLPELLVHGLNDTDARALLGESLLAPLESAVLDQMVAECHGNPLALVELARGGLEAYIPGGIPLPAAFPLSIRIEDGFIEQLRGLPRATGRLLLVAAAEPSGDLDLLWRAARTLGMNPTTAEPAQDAGLITIDTRLRFRHPLVRSAAYRAAPPADRRGAHAALAASCDPIRDPDRCAWHRAQASAGADENVAGELERSADRAQGRGGLAAAAAFLERAMELTPETGPRARRALAAARTKLQAGLAEAAARLLAVAESGPLTNEDRAHAGLLRGQLAFVSSHGRDAPPLLITAARQLEAVEPSLARDTYLDALAAALFVGRLRGDVTVHDVAAAARGAALPTDTPQDLLLNGLATTITDGYADGASRLKRAVLAFVHADMPVSESLRWLWLATHAAHDVWDEANWQVLCDRHIRLARQFGASAILPLALSARIGLHLFAGELKVASSLVDEIASVTAATGNALPPYGALALAAYRGQKVEAEALFDTALENARSRGEGMGLTLIQHAQAVLYIGLGQYEKALGAAQQAAEHPAELAFSAWSLLPLIEAAVRTGHRDAAQEAVKQLIGITGACGTEWALGVGACARALVSDGSDADRLYGDAVRHLSRTRLPLELARVRLLYGEWLRGHQRRLDAQEQLQAAHEAFTLMGAEGFAARTRRELTENGGKLHERKAQSIDELTAQEAQIARLAVVGRTNSEIAAELFLSPRTVEWHLGKVFMKLGITSRRQLRTALPATDLAGLGWAS